MENNNSCHELYRIIKGKDPTVCNFQCPFSSPAKYCYTLKTSLIFLDTFKNFISKENKDKYKIVLITESPYNFPGCPIHYEDKSECEKEKCEYWAENINEFISKHLQKYGLNRYNDWIDIVEKILKKIKKGVSIIPWHLYMPYDIFDFIFYTFFPIFKREENNKENWGDTFINKIYWTHVAKRSLKKLKEELNKAKKTKDEKAKKKAEKQLNNAIAQCILLLKEELEAIKPNLIIVATSYFWSVQCTTFKTIEKEQEKKKGEFLSLNDVIKIINKNNNKNKIIDLLSSLSQETKIVIFPNPTPSPKNYSKKVKFYKKEYVPKLIEKIHTEIKNNYNNLP